MKAQLADVRTLLLENADVVAIVGSGDGSDGKGGVWPGIAPLTIARGDKPFITMQLSSLSRPKVHGQTRSGGKVLADRLEFVLLLTGNDMDELRTLFEAVDVALEGKQTATCRPILLEDVTDLADYKDDASGTIVFAIAMNYVTVARPTSGA